MALTHKQEIAVERAWGMGLGQSERIPARLPSEHRTLIAGSLRIAADQYRKDAEASNETPRVAEQFTLQADLCEKIAELVEL